MDIYIDSAASALKSESVIRAQTAFLQNDYANAGRGTCARAARTDSAIENVRRTVAEFINARPDQIVFTSGTTDGMNRIARMIDNIKVILVSDIDHHSARLPFKKYKNIELQLDDNFNYCENNDFSGADAIVITAMSNVMGTAQDVKKIITAARKKNPNIITIVDAAQYVVHAPIDALDWDPDFLCFSGHKIGSDTGVGVMYIKDPNKWTSDNVGGGQFEATGPAKFEAGTLPLTQIVGLGTAIDEMRNAKCEARNLLKYLRAELSKIGRIKFISPPDAHVLTFTIDGMHYLDFGAMMGARGVCLRAGNMCASWFFARLGIDGASRISVGPWNTMDEMEQIIKIIKDILK